jgi:methyl-accepting chemotaxis protein
MNILRKASLTVKLTLSVLLVLAVTLIGSTLFRVQFTTKQMDKKAQVDLQQQMLLVINQLQSYNSGLDMTVSSMVAALASRHEGKVTVDADHAVETGSVSLPVLRIGDAVINNDSSTPDAVAKTVPGGMASILVRKGDDFYRVATSIRTDKGESTVGAAMGSANPCTAKLLAGKECFGRTRTTTGVELIARFSPIKDEQNNVIGGFGAAIDISKSMAALKQSLLKVRIGETGYFYAIDAQPGPNHGNFTIHPSREGQPALGIKDSDGREFLREMLEKRNGELRYPWFDKDSAEGGPREKLAVFAEFPEWNWVVAGATYTEEVMRDAIAIRNMLLLSTLLVIAVSGAILVYLVRQQISRPLALIVGLLRNIGDGKLNNRIDVAREDEIGQLLLSMQLMQGRLAEMIGEVRNSADQLSTASAQVASSSQRVVAGSQQQSEAASGMAASVEELTISIGQVSENALAARELSADSGRLSQEGNQIVHRAADGITHIAGTVQESSAIIRLLGEQSGEISTIVNVIKEIADQTNLLALNAAIEAARAGEQGRGFAVVADEVRKLAERTAQSTAQITETISKIQSGTHDAVQSMEAGVAQVNQGIVLAGQAGDAIVKINETSLSVVRAITDISSAIEEQSQASKEIARGVENIAQTSEQNTESMRESASVAQELQSLAKSLQLSVSRFRT